MSDDAPAQTPDEQDPTVPTEVAAAEAPETTKSSEDEGPLFTDLGLHPLVLAALKDVGYERPSKIQAATIPPLLEGRDVVGLAQTGTGKTAAFALPVLSDIDPKAKAPQALVLAPTRELALQVAEAFEKYAAKMKGVKILPIYGGQGYGVQLSALRRGVHVVVGTPGRIMDHIEKGTLDLSEVKHLVLDEADEMLKMGFADDVDTILAETPDDKQVALFSATMPPMIRKISAKHLNNPVEVTVKGKTTTNTNITQRYLMVSYPQKVDALTRIFEVENFEAMIVFVRTKNETETLAEKLRARGFSAAAISGDVAQAQRERTVNQLKSGKLDILVATDVAARGLDVERISHVVNYDIPTDTESYVHRIGRTGRAGRHGEAISFITPRERYLLRIIEKATKQPLTEMTLPSVEDVNSTRLTKFDDAIDHALADTEKVTFFRDVVAHYVRHHDVPELDVAAALAVVLQGDEPLLLEPEPERPARRQREDRFERNDRDRGERGDRGPRKERPAPAEGLASYRINVGRRHKVEPRQIVGALANEGGLQRSDFGRIEIRMDHAIVELPEKLSQDTWDALKDTRISGKLIELAKDSGRPQRREGGWKDREDRGGRGGYGGGRSHGGDRGGDRGGYKGRRDDRPARNETWGDDRPKKPRHKG